MSNPVLKDGELENFTIKIQGKMQRCPKACGGNVFHKPDDSNLNLFKCNSCGCAFEAE